MTENKKRGYTIGIGLTDRCNSDCPHCYSRPKADPVDLDFKSIQKLLNIFPVQSINFGTGESILYHSFTKLLDLLKDRSIDISLTTNGLTVEELSDSQLLLFHDIDFSVDFPHEPENDAWRGTGSFQSVMRGIKRCKNLGVEVSLVTCLMKPNCKYMGKMAELSSELGLNLRINTYKLVNDRTELLPSYDEFWTAIEEMMDSAYLLACSEPVVNAAIGNLKPENSISCGNRSFRIHPDGSIVPCVYLSTNNLKIDDINILSKYIEYSSEKLDLPIPQLCQSCQYVEICRGGCPSRRILSGKQSEPDEYCFVKRNQEISIKPKWKESKNLVHENYLCTMIFSG